MPKANKSQTRSDPAGRRAQHARDHQKESFWRRHIDGWGKSNLAKAAYCQKNGLTYSSFLFWCREIDIRDREKAPSAPAAVQPEAGGTSRNPFVPVRLVTEVTRADQQLQSSVKRDTDSPPIEIVLPGGAVMRLRPGCNVELVAGLLSALQA